MSTPVDSAPARRTWNRTPVGSQRSGAAPGTAQYFADLRAYRYGYETPFLPSFFRYETLRGKRVLEIGIGNGIDATEMARNGAIYTGIDVTERHIELTRKNFELQGLPEPRNSPREFPRARILCALRCGLFVRCTASHPSGA